MNHENYDQRMNFVQSILKLNRLETSSIETIDYDPASPFPYNNYIYLVTLATPIASTKHVITSEESDAVPKPGTSPIPTGCASIIMRLSNHDARTGINFTNRIENEVAFMTLVRQALAGSPYADIVPRIYAWASMASGQGFTMQEHMPGVMRKIKEMGENELPILREMAEILSLLQKFDIPPSIDQIGGLTFDTEGQIISGQMSLLKAEPSVEYETFVRNWLKAKLDEADENPVMQGWTANEVRVRLDKYLSSGLQQALGTLKDSKKCLVHSDFTCWNFLFDADNHHIIALLDFDFSCIATAADEFMVFSLSGVPGGKLPGIDSDPFELSLRAAMLAGFSQLAPEGLTDEQRAKWEVAKAWDSELTRSGAARPSTIPQFEKIADIFAFADSLSPWALENEAMRKRKTEAQLLAIREETEREIIAFLDRVGY